SPNGLGGGAVPHGLQFEAAPMRSFEVLERRNATQVEGVLADAAVSSTRPLAAGDVCEPVFDGNPLPQTVAATGRRDEMAKALLERLVGADADLASAICGLGALRT